jgi:carnitine-CoA ligase
MAINMKNVKRHIQFYKIVKNAIGWVIFGFLRDEYRRGTLLENLKSIFLNKGGFEIAAEMSWAELLEERAALVPDKKFLLYRDEEFTYKQMDNNANKVAHFLLGGGCGKGTGVGILMRNSPRYLDFFFGAQKIGMYALLINAQLKGEGLSYVINHSDIECLVLDAELIEPFEKIKGDLKGLKKIWVNDIEEESKKISIPDYMGRLSAAYKPDVPSSNPGIGYNKEDKCLIIYTSGTTGQPKGVMYKYKRSTVKKLSTIAGFTLKKDDIYYTTLPLSHGNALFTTLTTAMAIKCTIALGRKFSASKFWDEIRRYNVTIFNTVGSIIPILLKQPEKPTDRQHKVRCIQSTGCPSDMWEKFEDRFGVSIYEAYSAVDAGGKGIINYGNAPIGSVGKPLYALMGSFRIVDKDGNDVPDGTPGEMIYEAGGGSKKIEYYKNEKATNEKVKNGWVYSGDIMRKDKSGYFYFMGRNTDSMRKGGMNVSAFEVESAIMKHPAVEDVAVYAVPSELSEDEIMATIKLVEGFSLKPEELLDFLKDKLAKFATPRYIRFVNSFNLTSTHRIIKQSLKDEAVTKDTYDAKAVPAK